MREKGIIQTYISARGFGFVRTEKRGDIFFHCRDVVFDESFIQPGVEVEYSLQETDKGHRAVGVTLIAERSNV